MDRSFSPLTCFAALLWLSWFTWGPSWVSAQQPPRVSLSPIEPASPEQPVSGEELTNRVLQRLVQHPSVSAKVRHRSDLFGQRLVGAGEYLQRQSPRGTQVHFSLSIKTDDRHVNLVHVCDGRFLWMFDTLTGRPQLGRVDLGRLRRAAEGQGVSPLSITLGGGLTQLIGSLRDHFEFGMPQSVTFQGVPMWAYSGHWRPDRLASVFPAAAEMIDEQGRVRAEELPNHFPDRVFLLVGQDDLFPYHIDFRRASGVPTDAKTAGQGSSRSLATMELFEVSFGVELDPLLFAYRPSNVKTDDRTDEFLVQLRKRAQAAR